MSQKFNLLIIVGITKYQLYTVIFLLIKFIKKLPIIITLYSIEMVYKKMTETGFEPALSFKNQRLKLAP